MKIVLDENAYMPERAHPTDAGLDLRTPDAVKIWGGDSVTIDTGVHIELPPGTYAKLESKSGLNVKHGIVSCGGVIDEGYTGSISVKLYNLSNRAYEFLPGDKISQMIVQPYLVPELELADSLQETDRGTGAFGSTGR